MRDAKIVPTLEALETIQCIGCTFRLSFSVMAKPEVLTYHNVHIIIVWLLCNSQSESSVFHSKAAMKLFQCALHNV